MSDFDEITAQVFTDDQLNVIEAAARYEWWYHVASTQADLLVDFLLDKGIPPVVLLQVLQESTALFKKTLDEMESDTDE